MKEDLPKKRLQKCCFVYNCVISTTQTTTKKLLKNVTKTCACDVCDFFVYCLPIFWCLTCKFFCHWIVFNKCVIVI